MPTKRTKTTTSKAKKAAKLAPPSEGIECAFVCVMVGQLSDELGNVKVQFDAVTNPMQHPELQDYCEATPYGSLRMVVRDSIAKRLKPGACYKLTIEELEGA